MSPRPRKASDAEIFAATQRVMMRTGPGDLSLAQIAAEAGITAGALVQRFGSRHALLLAVMDEWAEGTAAMLEAMRRRRRSPLATVLFYAECMGGMGESPRALANHLAYLQLDLTDPSFRQRMLKAAHATRSALEGWLKEAVSAGELRRTTETAGLARLVEMAIGGSLLNWAVYQEGTAARWVRQDLETLLAPHLQTRRRRRPDPV